MGTHPHPSSTFPEFYTNPHIRSSLAAHRLWTVSDANKRPVDIVAALDVSQCSRCGRADCSEVHGAQLSNADAQLLTLDELTAALPNASNVTTHLDWRSSGLMVLDIEPECPTGVVDQLLRLVTGNTASPEPAALYAEVSGSGRGYHVLLPVPSNIASFPRAARATKLQHPQRWYEVLLYHWTTFTRRQIPSQRLSAAAAEPTGEMLTWEGVFGQLIEIAPGGEAASEGTSGHYDQMLALADGPDLTPMEFEVVHTVIESLGHESTRDLDDDFGGDTSRWEMSRLIRIAAIAHAKLHVRHSIDRITGTSTATSEQTAQQVLRVVHHVARRTLPPRAKHDERRSGASYLLKRCAEALNHLDTQS